MDRNRIIQTASWISIAGNFLLALLKIFVGITAGSMAVLADGIDSFSDIIISFMTLVVSFIIARPPDREHPYGHYRAETIASTILAFVIFFIGGQLCIFTIERIYYHKGLEMPEPLAVYVTLISIAGKGILSWSQFFLGKKTDSRMLRANGQNMLNDIITSTGVLAGLGLVFIFQIPLIDKILAILISIWIMASAVRIFKGLVIELMEGHEHQQPYEDIFAAVREVSGAANPHRVRVRKVGPMYVIDLDIEVNGDMSVNEAHEITRKIEMRIRKKIENVFDIVVHVEPLGNHEKGEQFGLSEKGRSGKKKITR